MAPTSWSRINFASSVTGVSGPTQSTPLCIASLTFMADLRCSSLRALGKCSFGSSALGLIIQGPRVRCHFTAVRSQDSRPSRILLREVWGDWLRRRIGVCPAGVTSLIKSGALAARSRFMSDLAHLKIWDDPAIPDSLSWYLDVAENRRPAKFRIAATLATQTDPAASSEDTLWAELERLTPVFVRRWQAIRAGASLPATTDGSSLLEVCRELAYRMLTHCNFCPWNCRVDRISGA